MLSDSYHYTLNNVYHNISNNNIIIKNNLLSHIDEKKLMSQKYLLKYLHDFFIFHNIDYSIFNNTLLGYHLFEGLHIFYHQIECIMMYRNFEEFSQELINDGFHIDFMSQYLCVISSSFMNKIQVKALIYFIHKDENSLYFLSPLYVNQCKIYKDLLKEKESYHLKFILLNQIFPCKKIKYEDFEVFIPNKIEELLQIVELKKDTYLFDEIHTSKKILKNIRDTIDTEENKSDTIGIGENNIFKNILELSSLFWK